VPSIIDYEEDGKTAIYYSPGDAKDLCEKMSNIIQDKLLIKTIGENAQEYLLTKSNEKTMAESIETVIKQIVRNK